MKTLCVCFRSLACGLSLVLGFIPRADAGFTVTLQELNGNVVANGTGTLLTGGLFGDPTSVTFNTPQLQPDGAVIYLGSEGDTGNMYSGAIEGPMSFGPSGALTMATSGSGDVVGLDMNVGLTPFILVPVQYTSGTPLSSSATWEGATFSSLGVTPGTYRWTWGSGNTTDFFLLEIGVVPVPEPKFAGPLMSLLALGAIALLSRRRRAQESFVLERCAVHQASTSSSGSPASTRFFSAPPLLAKFLRC